MLNWVVSAAMAASIAGAEMPPTQRAGSTTLELTSCGVRDTLWIDHYVAGLYLPPSAAPVAAADGDRAKAVRMQIVESRFLPSDIPEKWRHALQAELAREPMTRVREAYERLSDGDVITFMYMPDRGVTMQVNGKLIIRTPGHAVIDAILEAWAGQDLISGKLKRLTLEHQC